MPASPHRGNRYSKCHGCSLRSVVVNIHQLVELRDGTIRYGGVFSAGTYLTTFRFDRPEQTNVPTRKASGTVEEGGGIGVGGEERNGPGSGAQVEVPACPKPAAMLPGESKENEVPERGRDAFGEFYCCTSQHIVKPLCHIARGYPPVDSDVGVIVVSFRNL